MTIINIQNLCIQRDGHKILTNINLSLTNNQRLGIIGPNGAGKSFLLSILSADGIPSSGDVTILGKTFGACNLWELRKNIGFIATRQSFKFRTEATVQEVVGSGFFGAYGTPEPLSSKQIEKIEHMLQEFGLDDVSERLFSTLSDGEKRKALLCRALVVEPKLLIFDEPCMGLDIPFRTALLEQIDTICTHIPMVYVTHHTEELPSCITDVLLLKDGSIFKYGPKDEVLTSENVSKLFECTLEVIESNGLYSTHSICSE